MHFLKGVENSRPSGLSRQATRSRSSRVHINVSGSTFAELYPLQAVRPTRNLPGHIRSRLREHKRPRPSVDPEALILGQGLPTSLLARARGVSGSTRTVSTVCRYDGVFSRAVTSVRAYCIDSRRRTPGSTGVCIPPKSAQSLPSCAVISIVLGAIRATPSIHPIPYDAQRSHSTIQAMCGVASMSPLESSYFPRGVCCASQHSSSDLCDSRVAGDSSRSGRLNGRPLDLRPLDR